MNHTSDQEGIGDPFEVLGLPENAEASEVRARYLELIKRYPPERDPEQFQRIRAAFEATHDPLARAASMLEPPDEEDPPTWQAAIAAHARRPPKMQPAFVLSLGNRSKSHSVDASAQTESSQCNE